LAEQERRILVVDDQADVRRLVALVLLRKGYFVAEAANGRSALQLLQQRSFDLVITDVQMPEVDGLALLEQCVALYPQIDVIVLTAYGTIQNAVDAMKRGAVDYITKPFEIGDLEQEMDAWFERRRARIEARKKSPIEPLVELGRILSSQMNLAEMLDAILDLVQRTFQPISTEVVLYGGGPPGEADTVVAHSGEPPSALGYPRLTHEEAQRLAGDAKPWLFRDSALAGPSALPVQSGPAISVPLLNGHEAVGTLTLVRDAAGARYQEADAQLLQIFGFQMGISTLQARTRQRLLDSFHDLKQVTLSAVHALFAAIETYDQYTHDHSERVSRFAYMLGERVGMPGEQLETLRIAGLLHDIGKLGVGDGTLHKNGNLTADEFDRVKLHPLMGARILAGMEAFTEVVPIVLHHHERYDGTGYPQRLAGAGIPLGARIIALVDAFDSVTSDRPYRPAAGIEEAIRRLERSADTQLDGTLVREWRLLVEERAEEMAQAVGNRPRTA
jgi:putative nucleotidyltransferase with HDIG domain